MLGNTGSWTNFIKKNLENQGYILEKYFVEQSCSQLNKLANHVRNI